MTTRDDCIIHENLASHKIAVFAGLIAFTSRGSIIIQQGWHVTGQTREETRMSFNRRNFMMTTAAVTLLPASAVFAADTMVLKSSDVHPEGYPTVVAVQ